MDDGVDGLRRVMRRGNMRYGMAATVTVMGAMCAMVGGVVCPPPAAAAPNSQHVSPNARHPVASGHDEDLPDVEAIVEAFMRARRWVDSFDPPGLDDPASRIEIGNTSGVCVILRNARRVVGTGTAVIGTDSEPELLLRRAVGRALADVLGDPAVAALPAERREEIGASLTLEMEFAGPFLPLLGRDFHRIAQQVEPGLEGVAMRRGEARSMIFPSQLRAQNAAGNLVSRLPGLATELGLSAADLATLQRRHAVSVHRFRTTHLVQDAPSRYPFETFRGDQIVALSHVTSDSIAAFADGLASHLIGRMWDTPEQLVRSVRNEYGHDRQVQELLDAPAVDRRLSLGMRGDYDPIGDTYRPLVAPPLDQALAAMALLRYAAAADVDDANANRAREAAVRVLLELDVVEEGETDPLEDPAACAVVAMVLAEHPEIAREREAIERLGREARRVLNESFNPETGYSYKRRAIPAHSQALIAAAIANGLATTDEAFAPDELERARAAIDRAWQSVPPAQHVALLPWIGWAELDFATAAGKPVANVDAIRSTWAALEEARRLAEIEWAPDLAGGYPLAMGEGSTGSRPTAQTSRPAAFFATTIRVQGLAAEESLAMMRESQRETLRFLMQLSVRDSLEWAVRNPTAASGGVRSSVWDSRMPTAAQALTLIAAMETLASFR